MQGRNRDADVGTDLRPQWEKERAGQIEKAYIYTATWRLDSQWEAAAQGRGLSLMLCDNLGGGWGGGGRLKREERYIYNYDEFTSLYNRNQHNTVKQLSSNQKI